MPEMSCCAAKSQQSNSTKPFWYVRTKLQSFFKLRELQQKAGVGLSEVQDAWELHSVRNSETYHTRTQMAAQKADLVTSKSSWIAHLLLISFL